MRPTVYAYPGIVAEESLYIKPTIYTSSTIYREFVDPQEYDPEDIPPDGLGVVPMDRQSWNLDLKTEIREREEILERDSQGWALDCLYNGDYAHEREEIIEHDSQGWGLDLVDVDA